jgi:hypothetical protein
VSPQLIPANRVGVPCTKLGSGRGIESRFRPSYAGHTEHNAGSYSDRIEPLRTPSHEGAERVLATDQRSTKPRNTQTPERQIESGARAGSTYVPGKAGGPD